MRRIVMTKHMRMLPVLLVAVVALVLGAAAAHGRADNDGRDGVSQIPFADAKIIIELNATDQDVGIQVFLDGEAWKNVKIVSPGGRRILEVNGKGRLRKLGLTELFFESNEPSLDDLPLEEFLALFPEGEYTFLGSTVGGDKLVGAATLTHKIPDGPSIVSPEEGTVVDPKNTVIRWNPVTSPPGIEIVGYQVIVERENPLREFSVTLPATTTSVAVPPEFLEPGTEYRFEVLAIEAGGNQTITQSSFSTE